MTKTCALCSAAFSTEDKRRKFCGVSCYRKQQTDKPNAGTFAAGSRPWNRDIKGIHLSPASEFKRGQVAINHAEVGSVRIRDDKNGRPRAFVKTAEPNQWTLRAVLTWEAINGPVPRGKVVHHKDRDSLNDDADNLDALTRAEHLAEHRDDLEAAKHQAWGGI